jgi:hypothetical protein
MVKKMNDIASVIIQNKAALFIRDGDYWLNDENSAVAIGLDRQQR